MDDKRSENQIDDGSSSIKGRDNTGIILASRFEQIKKYSMYIMIAGFVISALIAIVAVLIGEFNEVIAKSLSTTLIIVVHSLLTVAFMSIKHKDSGDEVVIDTLFGVTAVSLVSSILGVWDVIEGQTVSDLYQASFYAVVAAFVIKFIMRANRIDRITRTLANAAIGMTVFAYLLVMPAIFINYPNILPEFYQRIMWATIILQVTISVLVAIFHRLYLNQHPELSKPTTGKSKIPTAIKVVIIILCIPFIVSILGLLIGLLFYRPYY